MNIFKQDTNFNKKRRKYNKKILKLLDNYSKNQPSLRFGQMLVSLNLNKDIFNEEPWITYDKLKEEIDKRGWIIKHKKFVEDFYKKFPKRKIIFLCLSGSNYFDLNSKNSDTDYYGIYLPSKEEINTSYKKFFVNNQIFDDHNSLSKRLRKKECETLLFGEKSFYLDLTNKESKNSKEDVDFKLISIFEYFNLLKKANFSAIELLFPPEDKILIKTAEFDDILLYKHSLIMKNSKSFLGFIRRDFKKNGFDQFFYSDLRDLKSLLLNHEDKKLKEIEKELIFYSKNKKHVRFGSSKNNIKNITIYESTFEETTKSSYVLSWIEKKINNISYRKKEESHKGLYHSMRLIYEVSDLLTKGELDIPFSEERKKILMDIKNKRMSYSDALKLINKGVSFVFNLKYEDNSYQIKQNIDKIYFFFKGRIELGVY